MERTEYKQLFAEKLVKENELLKNLGEKITAYNADDDFLSIDEFFKKKMRTFKNFQKKIINLK